MSSFSINSSTGQLQTRAGVTYDYETKNSYSVIVNVSDGKDAAGEADTAIDDSIDVTINLMNVADAACAEPPVGLASAVNDDASGIVLTWEAPSGCSPDTYAVYRRTISEDGSRMARLATVDDAGLTYTDGNVSAGETYRYRVRSNDQGPRSAWTQTVMTEPEPKPGERADRSVLRNTVGTLVSNIEEDIEAYDFVVGTSATFHYSRAQSFKTGDNAPEYTLSNVRVRFGTVYNGAVPRVSIYTATMTGGIRSSLYVLTNPATVTSDSVNRFTAPAGSTLEKDTEYFVVFEDTSSASFYRPKLTSSDDEDSKVEPEWEIGDN